MNNAGNVTLPDNTLLTLRGTINNTGSITLKAGAFATDLLIDGNVTLGGHGQVTLTDSSLNTISGASATARLENVDNTISGSGQFGIGQLTLINDPSGGDRRRRRCR